MSTIGSLLGLMDPGILPYNAQELTETSIRGGNIQNQTGLLELVELRRQQEAAAQARVYLQQNPGALGGGEGGPQSTLGGMAPGAPPMMQQTAMPGQPPGPPQMVPGGQDLSRFAGGAPPQSMLGGMAPQQGPPQGNPLEALMRQNPDAALQVMDLQAKRQAQQLTMRARMAEYMGSVLQAVTSQDSLEEARREVARVAPEWAQRLPETYSADAIQPFIERALSVKDKATLQLDEVKAQAELTRARMSGRVATTDQYLTTLGVRPGQETPEDMRRALTEQTNDQARVQAANVTPQIVEGEGGVKYAVNPRTREALAVPGPGQGAGEPMRGPMTADDKKIADYASRMREGQTQVNPLEDSGDYTAWKAPLAHLPGGRTALSGKQQQYENAKGLFLQGILRRDSQGQITETEWRDYSRIYFPQPGEGADQVKQKRAMREGAIRAQEAVLGRPGVPGAQTAPATAPATGPLPPVSGMSREELLAERARERARLRGGR